jgi:hypothetical protein
MIKCVILLNFLLPTLAGFFFLLIYYDLIYYLFFWFVTFMGSRFGSKYELSRLAKNGKKVSVNFSLFVSWQEVVLWIGFGGGNGGLEERGKCYEWRPIIISMFVCLVWRFSKSISITFKLLVFC